MVVGVGRRRSTGKPIEEIGVGTFEKRLVAFELRGVETGKIRLGERAEHEVGLATAAMPGAV